MQGGAAMDGYAQGGYARSGLVQGGSAAAGGGGGCAAVCCGDDQGPDVAETTFRFVGQGAGEFDTVSAPKRSSLPMVIGLLLGLVVLGVVALALFGTGATSTTSNAVQKISIPVVAGHPAPPAPAVHGSRFFSGAYESV